MRSAVPLLLVIAGCAADDSEDPPTAPLTCVEGELTLPDGSCIRPGIPADGCAEGFAHDGEYGCEAVLPPEPCPVGSIAVPGDASCRPVMPCGRGPWGDLPIDATTQHVDAFYVGVDSDGSAAKPWQTIGDALAVAAPGALVALAEGIYVEDVVIANGSVRLRGVCPERVSIVGEGSYFASISVRAAADGTEIGGVTVRGPTDGIQVTGSQNVLVDRVHVHAPDSSGVSVQDSLGPTSVIISGSLIEESHGNGVIVFASAVNIDGTAIRGTLPENQTRGYGVHAQLSCDNGVCDPTTRANVTIQRSLLERNQKLGLSVGAVDATVEGTVVRGTVPEEATQLGGRGIGAQDCGALQGCATIARANLAVRKSIVESNHEVGISVSGSDVSVQNTVVRANLPRADGELGGGIYLQLSCPTLESCDPATRSTGSIASSLVEGNHEIGVLVGASDATVESSVVRGTLPRAVDQLAGRGIDVTLLCPPSGCVPSARGRATVKTSLIEHNHEIAVHVAGSEADIDAVVIRQTFPQTAENEFGDGISVVTIDAAFPAAAKITRARVEASARAGISNFGASVAFGSTHLVCNGFDIEGATAADVSFVFEELAPLLCGCPKATDRCVAVSSGLQAPEPLGAH